MPVSLGLVTTSKVPPPKNSRILRNATDTEEPMTTCSRVVSVVSRDSTSPVRVISKNPGLSFRT